MVIPAGLGILATEFIWARNLLSKIHNKLNVKGGTYAKEAERTGRRICYTDGIRTKKEDRRGKT